MFKNEHFFRKKALLSAFMLLFFFVTIRLSAQIYPNSDPSNSGGWILNTDVSDEFDGTVLDEVKWQIQGKDGIYKSNFKGRQPSQFSPNNALVEDGKLKIRTKWEPDFPFDSDCRTEGGVERCFENITTAAVISKQQFQYGYMEIMCKAANAEVTSSFWTTGFQSELDMFEMFGGHKTNDAWKKRLKFNMISWDPNNYYYLPDGNGPAYTENIQASENTADAFHIYGFDWTSEYVKVYIDGVLTSEIYKSDVTNNGTDPDAWVTDVPYWVWVDSETFWWLGLPEAADLATPVDYEIEYIRVWQESKISVTATANASEPSTNGEFKISLPNGNLATQDINISYTVGGTASQGADYSALSGIATIASGSNSTLIAINVLDDTEVEQDETVIITLTSASIGNVNTAPAQINISDSATILTAGDIAIVGWKAEGNENGAVAFMLLKDITTGTKVSFSNRSWKGTQDGWTGDYSVDDVWTWTATMAHNSGEILVLDSDGQVKTVKGGSQIVVGNTVHDLAGKIASSDDDSDFDLSNSGDAILVYQVYGTFSEPTDPNSSNWITGININGGWGTGGGNTFCALPTALTNGLNANAVGSDQNNGVYKEKLLGSISLLRNMINNSSNWITDESLNYNLWSYNESLNSSSGDIGIAGTLGLNTIQDSNRIIVYPNPINTFFSKDLYISSPITNHVNIYNISGVKVIDQNKEVDPLILPLEGLTSGIYFISLKSERGTITKKIIIE
ncbi:T9SS type A sorting domain-containing protein [Flavivirga rizhaonensis]|uniref:Glycosyl hydrolase family protein n=1 Tax=Flavivirga rizhaonensis TaxID=2559571 RepID=A0A4S1DTS1_9FLAO|nr:family 16 glycosylhydrolase [Flavivirga rizhaonensis]TGV00782.1 glycosyl hydrolase family protein [Flavivirga rizhaonensis]